MLSDIDALNIHVAAVAKDLGLTASARWIEAGPSDTSGGRRVEVVVANPEAALERRTSVTADYYQNVGVHTFDEFIRASAIPGTSAP